MARQNTGAKTERVRQMFGSIAWRYDLANHVLSCGADFYWRRRAAQLVANWQPNQIIDLATGTGDLALAIQHKVPAARIVAADFLPEMLQLARRKGLRETLLADVAELAVPDSSFDCVTVAFGLRNMEHWGAALQQMARILKPDGHILVLEFSLPQMSILRTVYRFYLHQCLPVLGSFLTRQKNAYTYLSDSIEEFPSGESMVRLMEANHFRNATAEPLSGGIVTIYTAQKGGMP